MTGKVLLSLISTLVTILSIEFASFIFLSESRKDQIFEVIERDQNRLWRNRSLRDLNFFGGQTKTDKHGFRVAGNEKKCSEDSIKVGLFGASPSFGWGVEYEQTYWSLIQKELNRKKTSRSVCMKNFSMIGYSSTQGAQLIKEVLDHYNLDMALITYMVNDLDFIRFFYEDYTTDEKALRSLDEQSSFTFKLKKFLFETHSFRLFTRLSTFLNPSLTMNADLSQWPGQRRVSKTSLIKAHKEIVEQLRASEVEIAYARLPIGLHFFYQKYAQNCDKSDFSQEEFVQMGESLKLKEDSKRDWESVLEKCPFHHQANFLRLMAKEMGQADDKDLKRARLKFEQSSAIYSMSELKAYDRILEDFAKKKAIPLIFLETPSEEAAVNNYFLSEQQDFVHPSPYGHVKISDELVHYVKELVEKSVQGQVD